MNRDLSGRIAVATCCGRWRNIADKYDVAVELDNFCQAENMDGAKFRKVDAAVRELVAGHRATILHAPFNELFPAAIDPEARKLAMSRYRRAAELALSYGVRKMVVHSGYMPYVYFKEWHIPRSVEFWTEFMSDMPGDFQLVIENVLDDEPDMMRAIAEGIDDPRVGICYDVGHANIVSDRSQDEWMEVLAPCLKHLHIHNNDGKTDLHRGLDDGTLDMERILDGVLTMCSEDTTITAEILSDEESFHWLEKKGYIRRTR